MVIKMQAGNVPVTIDVRVTGQVLWRYVYYGEDFTYDDAGTNSGVHTHVMGLPQELRLGYNEWRATLTNQGAATVACQVDFTWRQGETTLATWSKPLDLPSGAVAVVSGSATLA